VTAALNRLAGLVVRAAACLAVTAAPAIAQPLPSLPSLVPRPAVSGFLPRADLEFSLATLGSDDPRFTNEGSIAVDVDVADYGAGRVNIFAAYQGVMGNERHTFDLNQGLYILEFALAQRIGSSFELGGVFHHTSRHLSDRAKPGSVSWNMLAVRATGRWAVGRSVIDSQIALAHVQMPHFVDYHWTTDASLAIRSAVHPHADVYVAGHGTFIGVYGMGRDENQTGARAEAGIRLHGTSSATLDVFVAYERRIDGYAAERARIRLTEFGFRLGG
jgi:hypothetical protein